MHTTSMDNLVNENSFRIRQVYLIFLMTQAPVEDGAKIRSNLYLSNFRESALSVVSDPCFWLMSKT